MVVGFLYILFISADILLLLHEQIFQKFDKSYEAVTKKISSAIVLLVPYCNDFIEDGLPYLGYFYQIQAIYYILYIIFHFEIYNFYQRTWLKTNWKVFVASLASFLATMLCFSIHTDRPVLPPFFQLLVILQ